MPRQLPDLTHDPRWQAVVTRDPSCDGTFFYSVRTTGVYCYPSCAARTPLPEHVVFFATRSAAEHAGFRPCKRCRADLPPPAQRDATWVAGLCRLIETSEPAPTLPQLAARVGKSPAQVRRIFARVTGLTPKAYAMAHRARNLRKHLQTGDGVTEAMYRAGYTSPGRLYAHAKKYLGMSPTAYRTGNAPDPITFAVGPCSLGAVLVAATTRGVCDISLGDDPEHLLQQFQQHFAASETIGNDPDFAHTVARVIELLDHPAPDWAALPLDIRGTVFQCRVWDVLTTIGPGQTATYKDIACAIGQPKAVRAVARACAHNRLAVAIPCHRVVRSDGQLAGYRWGLDRKRALLEREREV